MKKKITLLLLTMVCALCCAFGLAACGGGNSDSGTLKYKLKDDGTYEVESCDLYATGEITVPDTYNGKPVTSIGEYAFQAKTDVTNIILPNSIVKIGNGAFIGCRIASMTIPENVTSMGENVFYNCQSLETVVIPNGVTSIGKEFFANCTSLKDITIPNSVTTIGEWAFHNCSSLTSIKVPNSVTSIDDGAFDSCTALTSLDLPALTNVGRDLAKGCTNIKRLKLALPDDYDGLSNAQDYVRNILCESTNSVETVTVKSGTPYILSFENLKEVILLDGVTEIDYNGFYDSAKLEKIIIGNGVTKIAPNAFDGCSSLTSIEISRFKFQNINNTETKTLGELFHLGSENNSTVRTIKITDGVTEIPNNAFENCIALTEIVVPDSVKTIGTRAFWNCSNITDINVPNGVTRIEEYTFADCHALESITIPSGVTAIEDGAFSGCDVLKNVTIPNGITSIKSAVFSDCDALESITIPNGVTKIESAAFRSCSKLTEINVPDSVEYIGSEALDGTAWYNNQADGVVYAGKVAYKYKGVLPEDKTIIIKDGTKGIAAVFCREHIVSIEIPVSVKVIGTEMVNSNEFKTIVYKGTKAQWNDIEKANLWDRDIHNYTIKCTDGDIVKN